VQAGSPAFCVDAWCFCTAASSSLLTRWAFVHSAWAAGPTVPLGYCIMHTGGVVVATPRVAPCTQRSRSESFRRLERTQKRRKLHSQLTHPPRCLDSCKGMSMTTKWN
jgi:hypothetical protein